MEGHSALRGVIEHLRANRPLSSAAINEIERVLQLLTDEGWSGFITADEALRTVIQDEGKPKKNHMRYLELQLRYIRAEARERAEICVNSTHTKGALEIAVTGLWNIEEAAAQALGITEPTHAEITAAKGKSNE